MATPQPIVKHLGGGTQQCSGLCSSSFKTYGHTSTNKTFGGGGAHGSAQGCALAELGIQLGLAIV